MWIKYYIERETIWTLNSTMKQTGPNWATKSWKLARILLPPSRFDRQLSLDMKLDATIGVGGFDNIVYSSTKKCIPQWSSIDNYKFTLGSSTYYEDFFYPRWWTLKTFILVKIFLVPAKLIFLGVILPSQRLIIRYRPSWSHSLNPSRNVPGS